MEKLIKLLNEYENEIKKGEFYEWEKGIGGDTNLFRRDTRDEEGSHIYSDTADTYVISKKYGFIKRLVSEGKVTLSHRPRNEDIMDLNRSDYEKLLMMLAVEPDPIKYLISVIE